MFYLRILLMAAALGGVALPALASVCDERAPLLSADTMRAMREAEARYADIVAHGGWVSVPMQSLQQGDVSPNVKLLRLRLMAEGDLAGGKLSPAFDGTVAMALKRLQARYGLPETGILDQYTLRTLNVPASERLAELRASLERIDDARRDASPASKSVVVNIPAAEVEAVEDGRVAAIYTAMAGAPDRPSPELSSRITAINFHPGWTMPATLVREDLIPRMQKDPGYLKRAEFEVVDARGRPVAPERIDWHSHEPLRYTYRLPAGRQGPMGDIRLSLPNNDEVFMHDTPSKLLFSRSIRFLSSGCVRVQDIDKLAAWLLDWSESKLEGTLGRPTPRTVALSQPVPVQWVYVTAWATPRQVACFRPDIYNKAAAQTALR